jgi:DNA-directed RNA polymerase alpha subunit
MERLNSFENFYQNDELANTKLDLLGFSKRAITALSFKKIYTLSDLLSYSKREIINIHGIGEESFKSIEAIVNDLHLFFIEDIPEDIRKSIIIKYKNTEKLNNASLDWIPLNQHIKYYLSNCSIDSLGKIMSFKYYDLKKLLPENIFNGLVASLHSVGIKLNGDLSKEEIKEFYQKGSKLEQAVNYPIEILNIQKFLENLLKKSGINTIGDLIGLYTFNIKKLTNIEAYNDLINKMHILGFEFANERLFREYNEGEESNLLKEQIEVLNLPISILNPLKRAKIHNVNELLSFTPQELLNQKYLGPNLVKQLIDTVHQKGLKFKYEELPYNEQKVNYLDYGKKITEKRDQINKFSITEESKHL